MKKQSIAIAVYEPKGMKKKKVIKRKATHAAATKSKTMAQPKAPQNAMKQEAEEKRKNFDDAEKEIIEVLNKHQIPFLPEYRVQLRSWFHQQRQENLPPEMTEGPGVLASKAA